MDDARQEEERPRAATRPGAGEAESPKLAAGGDSGEARFASERDWMPELVLLAKNVRVWLSQLSDEFDREIGTRQDIPVEALERIANRGITGLWLIGLWERSSASAEIKRRTGRRDAVASAYAIERYAVADHLGGEEGKQVLEERARNCGIRLAADMVPNHMSIDSKWVLEHPDRFASVDEPPFPAYSFEGPDLCEEDGVEIRVEDGYYDQTDAAVIFERCDAETDETRYIYHGNDGISTPWNDTAQIDYLNAEAREAVVRRIVEIAREFPVVRFDAAMVLARKQIRRLWYPEPGGGGAIPSRAEHAMSDEAFEDAMPRVFWRDVVERIEEEAPETLLLAEAYWKMEGYFVRNLGMHRVYNSAFMHLLRDEDNAAYRDLMKETLAFDPKILERYVNYLNNPDEETAVEQFGTGEKYFGVCTMLATLPGTPLFGHGQFEGFEEKYAMDFGAPRLDEEPDAELLERHRAQISPLLERRGLFAGVEGFRLYDFERRDGSVDENVFAYSNRDAGERVLVVYHNSDGETAGRIRSSVPFRPAESEANGVEERREDLVSALGLADGAGAYVAFRDARSDLEYLQSYDEWVDDGLEVELGPYECRVLVDFEIVTEDYEGQYGRR